MTLRKSIILYGIAMAALIGTLKFAEYRFFVRDLSLELYLGLIAVLFIVLGVCASQEEIDKTISEMASMQEMYKIPIIRFGMTLFEILPVGIIVTLLSAAILRRKEILAE